MIDEDDSYLSNMILLIDEHKPTESLHVDLKE